MKSILTYFTFIILSINSFAQIGSVYSRYGIGTLITSQAARNAGMGDLGTTIIDGEYLNTINPAAMTELNTVKLEVGAMYDLVFASDKASSTTASKTYFSGFNLGLPMSSEYGLTLALGIQPYSITDYDVTVENFNADISEENYKTQFTGEGGISRGYVALSYLAPFGFSVGASMDFHFGERKYKTEVEFFDNSNYNTEYLYTIKTEGFGGTFGIITPNLTETLFETDLLSDLRVGLNYSYRPEFGADTLRNGINSLTTDTLYTGSTTTQIPSSWTAGMSLVLLNSYRIYIDYMSQPWSEHTLAGKSLSGMQDAFKLSGGFEFVRSENARFILEQLAWRAGLTFERTPYKINNYSVDQLTFSTGVSLKVGKISNLNIALQYGMRGTTDSGLLKESLFKLRFGISLGEIWFQGYER